MSDELKLEVPTLTIGEEVKAEEAAPIQEVDVEDKIELTPEEQKAVDDVIQKLAIKTPDADTLVRNLSGGNAQKCVLGRWIAADSDILILDEATQGIDVGTKMQIYNLLDELAKQGKAIIFISSDLSEVMGVSDRILTMKAGKVINITDGKKANRTQILWEATVGKKEKV